MAKQRRALIGTICGVTMLLATALYAGLGMALDLWRSAVWIFAVGGILCAATAVILAPKHEE